MIHILRTPVNIDTTFSWMNRIWKQSGCQMGEGWGKVLGTPQEPLINHNVLSSNRNALGVSRFDRSISSTRDIASAVSSIVHHSRYLEMDQQHQLEGPRRHISNRTKHT